MTLSSRTFTYWSLLGLPPGSDSDQLKRAFKREAMRWHPDVNMNDRNAEERFKWINEAYLVLSDPKRRFEWEVAGRPSIKIEIFPDQQPGITASSKPERTTRDTEIFNSAEKLLLVLIASFSLVLLNAFTS